MKNKNLLIPIVVGLFIFLTLVESGIAFLFFMNSQKKTDQYKQQISNYEKQVQDLNNQISNLKTKVNTAPNNSVTQPNTTNEQSESTSNIDVTIDQGQQNQNTPQIQPICYRLNITNEKFASNKCYTKNDYNELVSYLQQYDRQVAKYNSAESRMEIVCNGSEFFEDSCDDAQADQLGALAEMGQLEGIINGIIAKGW